MLRLLIYCKTLISNTSLWSSRYFGGLLIGPMLILTLLIAGPQAYPQTPQAGTGLIAGTISYSADATHLEFSGVSDWKYDLNKKVINGKTVLELNVPAMDMASRNQFEKYSDASVSKVTVDSNGPDNSLILRIELANSEMDSFDYLTEQPSRLMVDLFMPKENSQTKKALVPNAGQKPTGIVKKSTAKVIAVKKTETAQREIASDINLTEGQTSPEVFSAEYGKGIFDGGDPNFDRFSIKDHEINEASIIRSQENAYVSFPMLLVENEHFKKIQAQAPVYSIIPRPHDEENELARFLVTLFERKRLNVYLKTLNMFTNKYPRSEYDEIIRFMTADVYFELWKSNNSKTLFNTANRYYREAIERYPKSKLANRSEFLMAYAAYNNQDYLGTIRSFEKFVKEKPASELVDRAKLGIARSFLKLKKFDDAERVYKEVEQNAFNDQTRIEASYLSGDVAFMAKEYDKALSIYQAAIQKFPESAPQYPNAFYNLSESLFWKGKYKASLDAYQTYLKKFPSHSHGGYAMTRIGEILDILGANQDRVMGAWLETYFRYGKTPGAAVARMRTLSRKMNEMKPKEADKAVTEIREIAKVSELPKIDLFSTLMISEGLANRKQYVKAADELLAWYRANPTTTDGDIIKNRMVRNINDEIIEDVNKGDFMGALKTHNTFGDQWLKGSKRIDTIYNLGRAFEQAGAFQQADQLYKDSLNKLLAVKGTPAEKERGVFEILPTEDQLQLRLAKTSVDSGRFAEGYEYLKEIQKPEKLGDKEQIERVQVSAKILESKGELESAKRYLGDLINNWKGQVDLVVPPMLDLAKLEMKSKDPVKAEIVLSKARQLLEDTKKIPSVEHATILSQLGEVYSGQNQTEKCIAVWSELLKDYDSDSKASIRFKLGDLYFSQGNLQKASETWDPLKENKNSFWYNLGQEKMKDQAWKTDYKKYIQRIPAMAELKK